MESVTFSIADLDGVYLGLATDTTVTIDADAAGHNSFVDSTPLDHSEFSTAQSAIGVPASVGHPQSIDFLTVVMHELGHVLGLADIYDDAFADDLMYGWLEAGQRRTASAELVDSFFDGEYQ